MWWSTQGGMQLTACCGHACLCCMVFFGKILGCCFLFNDDKGWHTLLDWFLFEQSSSKAILFEARFWFRTLHRVCWLEWGRRGEGLFSQVAFECGMTSGICQSQQHHGVVQQTCRVVAKLRNGLPSVQVITCYVVTPCDNMKRQCWKLAGGILWTILNSVKPRMVHFACYAVVHASCGGERSKASRDDAGWRNWRWLSRHRAFDSKLLFTLLSHFTLFLSRV